MNPRSIPERISGAFTDYTQGTRQKPLMDAKDPLSKALSITMTHFNTPVYEVKGRGPLSKGEQAVNAVNLIGNLAVLGLGVICPPIFIAYAASIALRKGWEPATKKLEQYNQEKATQNLQDARDAVKNTPQIDRNFTTVKTIDEQRKAHILAKNFLRKNLEKLGAKVEFLKPPDSSIPDLKSFQIKPNSLDTNIFSWEATHGVKEDIQRDGKRTEKNVILYGVASQFNASESTTPSTIAPGGAKTLYTNDRTQGPQAQLAFSDEQVEVINSGANIGYNALCNVLDENTKNSVNHGYITPHKDNGNQIIDRLKQEGHKTEYLCVANKPIDGDKPVHQVLFSAPAFGNYEISKLKSEKLTALEMSKKEEIQFIFALNGFRALFEKGIAEGKKGKEVIIKPTAIGAGAFENNPEVLAKAFWYAAAENQPELKKYGVQVRFQVFTHPTSGKADLNASAMRDFIGLQEFKPNT